MDDTRLDLRAADAERLREWEEALQDSRRRLRRSWQAGAALYPIVGRQGTLYGTRRSAPEERDEEIEMPNDDGRPTYDEALQHALNHARTAQKYAGSTTSDYLEKASANAQTSRAWSALAGLLRADETRAEYQHVTRHLREEGLTPTGRRVRDPQPQDLPLSTSFGPVYEEKSA